MKTAAALSTGAAPTAETAVLQLGGALCVVAFCDWVSSGARYDHVYVYS